MANKDLLLTLKAKDLASQDVAKLEKSLGGISKQSIGFGIGMGIGAKGLGLVTAGAQAVAGSLGGMVEKASALDETVNKVAVVFGSSAGMVNRWGDTTARAMGLSKQAAEEAAASIGNLLLSTGTAPEKVAPMSTAIVGLAADLASFNNIPVEDALAKLQSGLVGQERPLRELGVAISAASVDTEAAVLGFKKLNGQFSEGEKVQARYSLIFKQTATAQGDFARTSDGLANSQRKLNAEWDDLQAKIGEHLIPALEKLASMAGAAFDIIDNTKHADALVDQTKAFIAAGYSTNTYKLSLAGVQQQLYDMVNSGKATEQEIRDLYDVTVLLEGATHLTTGTLATAASGFGGYHNAVTDAIGPLTKTDQTMTYLARDIALAGKAAEDAKRPTKDYFDIYTSRSAQGDLAQTTLNIMDDRKAVDDARKAMEKATPGTQAYKRAQLELAVVSGKLSGDLGTLHQKQAALFLLKPDPANKAALDKWFSTLGHHALDLQGDLKAAYDQLYGITGVKPGSTINFSVTYGGKKLAAGGALFAGESALVGENGPERITALNDMYVHPSGGGGGGSSVVLKLVLPNGRVLAELVDEHLYYALSRSSPSAVRK